MYIHLSMMYRIFKYQLCKTKDIRRTEIIICNYIMISQCGFLLGVWTVVSNYLKHDGMPCETRFSTSSDLYLYVHASYNKRRRGEL